MTDRIPIETAARIIGVLPQYLRQEMARGHIDLGYVAIGKHRNNYIVMKAKLEKFIGRELTEQDLK